jgi:hypothetical protein
LHSRKIGRIADACIYYQSGNAVRAAGDAQQFTEHSVRGIGKWSDHQDIAGLADLDSRMNHEIVARVAQHRYGGAGNFCRGINRTHVWPEQTGTSLRFVNRGDAQFSQQTYGFGIRAANATNNFVAHV